VWRQCRRLASNSPGRPPAPERQKLTQRDPSRHQGVGRVFHCRSIAEPKRTMRRLEPRVDQTNLGTLHQEAIMGRGVEPPRSKNRRFDSFEDPRDAEVERRSRCRTKRPCWSTPTGTRTPVPWLRTKYPRPLDDGGQNMHLIINLVSGPSSNQWR
jgi:hypothetical protein